MGMQIRVAQFEVLLSSNSQDQEDQSKQSNHEVNLAAVVELLVESHVLPCDCLKGFQGKY